MSRRLFTGLLFGLFLFCTSRVQAQPQRQLYFPFDEAGENAAALDPGELLLARSILLTNLYPGGNVSFSLSYDRKNWASYGMGPRYSSFFTMKNQLSCYIVLITNFGPDRKVRKEYLLSRGRCYSIFWNKNNGHWDLQENPCRRE